MTLKIAVVYEAKADYRIATELADRVFVESIDWLDNEIAAHQRLWLTTSRNGEPLTWTGIKKLASDSGINAMGHFDGQPGLADATAARRAIRYLMREFQDVSGVLLVRDQDDQEERRNGLEQARSEQKGKLPIVVGLAVVERENWVLCGFDPADNMEANRLDAEAKELGFDPRTKSHELSAHKSDHAKRSPKRVLRVLCGGDARREQACWQDSALAVLRDRGQKNGLAAFLQEVRDKFAELIGHPT